MRGVLRLSERAVARLLIAIGGSSAVAAALLMSVTTLLPNCPPGSPPGSDCFRQAAAAYVGDGWLYVLFYGALLLLGTIPRRFVWVFAMVGWAWTFESWPLWSSNSPYQGSYATSPPDALFLIFYLLELAVVVSALGLARLWWVLAGRQWSRDYRRRLDEGG